MLTAVRPHIKLLADAFKRDSKPLIIFDDKFYTSKTDIVAKCKSLAAEYKNGDALSAEDQEFIIQCLNVTPYGQTLLDGIICVEIVSVREPVLALVYQDRRYYFYSSKVFSLETNQRQNADRAMWLDAIHPKRTKAMKELSCHHDFVDGMWFSDIRDGFLVENGLTIENIEVFFDRRKRHFTIRNRELRDKWVKYHDERAKLQWITQEEHDRIHKEEDSRNHCELARIKGRVKDDNSAKISHPVAVKMRVRMLSPVSPNCKPLSLRDNTIYLISKETLRVQIERIARKQGRRRRGYYSTKWTPGYPTGTPVKMIEVPIDAVKAENRGKAALANRISSVEKVNGKTYVTYGF